MSATVAPSSAAASTSRSRVVSGFAAERSAEPASSGSITVAPEATRRMESARPSAGWSLTRNPLTPLAIARCR